MFPEIKNLDSSPRVSRRGVVLIGAAAITAALLYSDRPGPIERAVGVSAYPNFAVGKRNDRGVGWECGYVPKDVPFLNKDGVSDWLSHIIQNRIIGRTASAISTRFEQVDVTNNLKNLPSIADLVTSSLEISSLFVGSTRGVPELNLECAKVLTASAALAALREPNVAPMQLWLAGVLRTNMSLSQERLFQLSTWPKLSNHFTPQDIAADSNRISHALEPSITDTDKTRHWLVAGYNAVECYRLLQVRGTDKLPIPDGLKAIIKLFPDVVDQSLLVAGLPFEVYEMSSVLSELKKHLKTGRPIEEGVFEHDFGFPRDNAGNRDGAKFWLTLYRAAEKGIPLNRIVSSLSRNGRLPDNLIRELGVEGSPLVRRLAFGPTQFR